MVWDGEVAGMRLALESLPVVPLLVLSDSRAALAAVRSAASAGVARTTDLRKVVDLVGEWALFFFFIFFFYSQITPHSPAGMAGEPERTRNSRC